MYNAKLIIIALIGAFMFTSCEKEDSTPTSNQEKMKTKSNNVNKSLESELSDFIEDVMDDVDPGEFESGKALLYLESAMNFEYNNIIGNDEEFPVIQNSYRVEDLDVSGFQSGEIANGNDVLTLKTDIFEAIDQIAEVAADTISGEGDLYITAIDIDYDEYDINSGVHLNFSLGRFAFLNGGCNGFNGDYYYLNNMGGCNNYGNAGTLTNIDAIDQIDANISNRYCNSNIAHCPSGGPPNLITWLHVRQVYNPTRNINNVYLSKTNWMECITEAEQISAATSIKNWQSSNWPSFSRFGTVEVKNCHVQLEIYSGSFKMNLVNYVGVCQIIQAELKPRVAWSGSL